jgi:hypothetical protein
MKVLVGKDIEIGKHVYHVCLQFQPRDVWVGVYWERMSYLSIYVCIIPMFPLHFRRHTLVPREEQ